MSSSPEAPLLDIIKDLIQNDGPITVADYMSLVLDHPSHGYYRTQEPFGAAGDFITAPEISQVFGELLGLWLATAWHEAGRPAPFRLVELGPGRGQLMADLVRATTVVDGFLDSADIHLVESSERLRGLQRRALSGHEVQWHDRLQTVPPGPLFLIANEFLDALPVHQLIRTGAGWAERRVDLLENGALGFSQAEAPLPLVHLVAGGDLAEVGQIAEVSPARCALAESLGERLSRDGGTALLVDYGAFVERPTGDTLQAVRHHRRADPLQMPGLADITTQVDFRSIAEAAAAGGAAAYGPVPQGPFLRTLGIEPRIAALLRSADEDQRQTLRGALFRLTDAGAMGEVFKVLVLAAVGGAPPPGFTAPTLVPEKAGLAARDAS